MDKTGQRTEWQLGRDAFYKDGSLRDIYVQNTTLADWDKFLETVSSKQVLTFVNGESHPLPTQANELLKLSSEASVLLEIKLGKVGLNCHFFTEEEIELDIDPSEVTSQQELDAVVDMLADIGNALRKDVILTDENMPESIWFIFDALNAEVRFLPAGEHNSGR